MTSGDVAAAAVGAVAAAAVALGVALARTRERLARLEAIVDALLELVRGKWRRRRAAELPRSPAGSAFGRARWAAQPRSGIAHATSSATITSNPSHRSRSRRTIRTTPPRPFGVLEARSPLRRARSIVASDTRAIAAHSSRVSRSSRRGRGNRGTASSGSRPVRGTRRGCDVSCGLVAEDPLPQLEGAVDREPFTCGSASVNRPAGTAFYDSAANCDNFRTRHLSS